MCVHMHVNIDTVKCVYLFINIYEYMKKFWWKPVPVFILFWPD